MKFKRGDDVYVTRSVLKLDENAPLPFVKTVVREHHDRSVKVQMPDGSLSKDIATSKVARNFGILIIRIGDFNEDGLLDPLAKSVLHYCRMVVPGDFVKLLELRTEDELIALWSMYHSMCQQVVIVGHGSKRGYLFGKTQISASRLVEMLSIPKPGKKEFISLGCQTGYGDFGRPFSSSKVVSHLLAPYHSVHGCVASLFTQTFIHERLLTSVTTKIAFNRARKNLKSAASFRLWKNGDFAAG